MFNLKKIAPSTYILPQEEPMRVPGLVICSEKQLQDEHIEKPLIQVKNVACLPGIVNYSIAMPDIHWGYGFPIGGVAATDGENGVISPGGVGYDINCGVRLALVPLLFRDMKDKVKEALLKEIYRLIPSGTGQGTKDTSRILQDKDYAHIVQKGARWSIEQGYGFTQDIEHCESYGLLENGDIRAVSSKAKMRGKDQLGSIGSGNHFVEIGEVEKLLQPQIAEKWSVKTGQTYILIHTGSRGFGHQICQDTLHQFIKKGFAENLPDKQLVAAPLASPEGQQYLQAMAAAANFAFNNRQQILDSVRKAFQTVCQIDPQKIGLLYDVCHNIAKIETHSIDGTMKKLCVHRKGATRAYGPNTSELSPTFQETGQPVLVPGDMGRASYLMVGKGNPLTWCSACHGAGRARSRIQSLKEWQNKQALSYMREKGVQVLARNYRTIAEEMPDAYKDVDEVVQIVQDASLADSVAKLRPFLVLKG